jgi:carboxymethylenebutenolidase
MRLQTEWIDVPMGGKTCASYRARPAAPDVPLPAVLLVQEIWGVNTYIRDVAERFAAAGYLALAPDLYSVGDRPAELAPERIDAAKRLMDGLPPAAWGDPEQRQQAVAGLPDGEREQVGATIATLFGPRDAGAHVRVLRDAVRALLNDEECDGRIGTVGWCVGGTYAGLLACRERKLSAAVVFYGTAVPSEEVPALDCPLLGFYGAEDPRITGGVPAMAAAMRQAGKSFEYHIYAGAPHGFFNDTRPSYRVEAARDAWARCLAFLAQTLAPHVWGAA